MIQVDLSVIMAKKRIKTVSELSKRTGISRTTLLSLYHEKGKGVQFDTLDKLCEHLDVDIGDLIIRKKIGAS